MENLLTFIGFGEGAYHIAKGLRQAGTGGMAAYDVQWDSPEFAERIKTRAAETDVEIFPDLEKALRSSRFILSATSAAVAVQVARNALPYMNKEQIYVDINAASPMDMEEIGRLCGENGVKFCDAAVMGIIPHYGHAVPMILSGNGAEDFAGSFRRFGMRLEVIDGKPGGSSAIKMFRSIFVKGITELLIESFCAAERFGVLSTIVKSLDETLAGKTVEDLADSLIPRTLIHAKRRIAEMEDVQKTLESMGQTAHMSRATAEKLTYIYTSGVADALRNEVPKDYISAIRALLAVTEKNIHTRDP
jgi:3-hydroxyisobutyrate dehydrogenase-like beta-hydroxyacid dehydrogenase